MTGPSSGFAEARRGSESRDAISRERAENAAAAGTRLLTGPCGADLAGVAVALAYRLEHGRLPVLGTEVTLPAFVVDIGHGGWEGAARERIASPRSPLTVVQNAIASGIRCVVPTLVRRLRPWFPR